MSKQTSIGDAAFSFLLKSKKKNEVPLLKFYDFLTPINYDNPKELEYKWYVKDSYRARLYEIYVNNEKFQLVFSQIMKDFKKVNFPNDYEIPVNNTIKQKLDIYRLLMKYIMILYRLLMDTFHNKEAFIIEVNGFTGSGKSRYARCLVVLYAKVCKKNYYVHADISDMENKFFVDMGFKDVDGKNNSESVIFHVYVTYRTSESNFIIKKFFKEGDVIFQDEMPIMHGSKSLTTKDDLVNIIKVASRKKNINMLFITPNIIELDNVDYYASIIGINKKKYLSLCMYGTSEKNYIASSVVSVYEDPELTRYYEEVSKRRKTELMESGGFAGVGFDQEEKDFLIMILLEHIKKKGITVKYRKDVESAAYEIPEIVNCMFKEYVIQDVINMYKTGKIKANKKTTTRKKIVKNEDDVFVEKEPKKEEPVEKEEKKPVIVENASLKKSSIGDKMHKFYEKFEFDEVEALKRYTNKRDAEIYLKLKHGANDDELALEYDYKVSSSIHYIDNRVALWLSQKAGHFYEEFLTNQLKKMPNVIDAEHRGNVGEPDIIVYYQDKVEVYSVKCFNIRRKSINVNLDDIKPEIFHCKKLRRDDPKMPIICILHVYNMFDDTYQQIFLDFNNPPTTFNFKFNIKKAR